MTPEERDRTRRFRAERRRQIEAGVRLQRDAFEEIRRQLREAERRIRAALADTPSDYQSWRLDAIRAEIRRAMGVWEEEAGAVLTRGLDRSWSAGSDLVTEPLRAGGIDLTGRLPSLDPRLLTALQALQTDRIRDISTQATNRVNTELTQAVLGVQSPFEAASKVARILDAPEERARSIVRTELGTVYSEAGQQRMEQAVKLGVSGLQKMWRRSGKLHPRLTHDLADGQIVDVDKSFIVGGIEIPQPRAPSIPIGERINCGCSSLPHMNHWRVSTPGPRPYTAEEIARSPTARQVEQVRSETPVVERSLPPARVAELRRGLAETDWGKARSRGERLHGLTDDEALALHAYSYVREAGGVRDVNGPLRAGADPGPLAELVSLQTAALRKLPIRTGTVHRYLGSLPPGLDTAPLGSEWTERGFMSASADPSRLESCVTPRPHRFIVQSRTGRDFDAVSAFSQGEVLFGPGTGFRVLGRSRDARGYILQMEEMPP